MSVLPKAAATVPRSLLLSFCALACRMSVSPKMAPNAPQSLSCLFSALA
jgi:hypothetical protein